MKIMTHFETLPTTIRCVVFVALLSGAKSNGANNCKAFDEELTFEQTNSKRIIKINRECWHWEAQAPSQKLRRRAQS